MHQVLSEKQNILQYEYDNVYSLFYFFLKWKKLSVNISGKEFL